MMKDYEEPTHHYAISTVVDGVSCIRTEERSILEECCTIKTFERMHVYVLNADSYPFFFKMYLKNNVKNSMY